jgi:hypothetical protein
MLLLSYRFVVHAWRVSLLWSFVLSETHNALCELASKWCRSPTRKHLTFLRPQMDTNHFPSKTWPLPDIPLTRNNSSRHTIMPFIRPITSALAFLIRIKSRAKARLCHYRSSEKVEAERLDDRYGLLWAQICEDIPPGWLDDLPPFAFHEIRDITCRSREQMIEDLRQVHAERVANYAARREEVRRER